ncbi:CMGC/MAPK protein kinase [Phytophthora nicotianae P10297]|uniref:Mitogen-activated protein kinase n=6 Tax=Phytophthora nicotianae TaxID=4792 RepID=W2QTG9_PHYN3|nr:CMGC/MAPK protein kinase [Phytophthora nicotianae INRA-310]ETK95452.1 CMGC/MAPK protein kinase [Phytophthora nicotianae]ETN15580.1 CMGC/MAPK protein kinase [Phytophthora nicotianae INRA-310]ETO84389.1 CMGC/MAPK protein kinase [Phytophthora nicotianae P1976]ETP53451.1 CMGC/MAPK protein kinase [Phytophthora nicotianae P10297]
MMRRRESNLTLDEEEDVAVEIERIEQPWMAPELFEQLWLNATQQVSSSCTFTKYKYKVASKGDRTRRTEETETDTGSSFQQQFLRALGNDLVVFPPKSEQDKFVLAYASVTDHYGLRTVLLVRMEQLHDSEQIGITVKNTDPVHRTRMTAFLSVLQQRIQPGKAPKRPHPRSGDTSKLFLEESDPEGTTDSDSSMAPSPPVRTPPASSSASVETPPRPRATVPGNVPRPIERGRSHTIRYRTDRDISFEGYLSKKSDVLMSWKATYCVLEEDTLAFYETREDFISNSKLIGRIQLQGIEDEDMGKPNGFRVIAEGNHVNHLSSRTAFEKEQWKRAISIAISKAPEVTRPYVAFASQPLEPHKFYRLLGALLRQEIGDFPLLFRSMHPDIVVTSNFPPIVPFWGQYRRYDGVLLFISTLLDTVTVDNFSLTEVIELVRGDADCVDETGANHDALTPSPITADSYVLSPKSTEAKGTPGSASTPSAQWTKRLVVTGKETYNLLNTDNRRVTQLFVHELWLDHKDRLVRWHLNGDAVALSVAFDDAPRGENIRLVLPGEASAISHSIPPGTFYVQILRAQQLHLCETGNDHAAKGNAQHAASASAKKGYPVYARCILEEGTHLEQTLRGLDLKEGENTSDELLNGAQMGSQKEHRRPSKGTRFFRGLRRAAGISGERAVATFGDPSGCVTNICKCLPVVAPDDHHKVGTLNPDWSSNLRLEFPGCARGFTYYLKVEVFQSRFMLPDELLGVCKINVTPHLALVNGSADAKANGALPRWHNLCDQYNDCKESWAPPTVFRGRIQLGIIFAPTVTSAENFPQSQGLRRMASDGRLVESRRASADETLLQSSSSYNLREFLRSDKKASVGAFNFPSDKGGRFVSRQVRSRTDSSNRRANGVVSTQNLPPSSEENRELSRLARDNHTFSGKTTKFDVPKKYQLIKVVGAGTYGEVVAASDIESGTTVAIKKVTNAFQDLPDTKRILRELCLLRQLSHPNLIQLYDVPRPERLSYLEDIYLVTDLMETDLHRVIHSTQTLTDEHVAHFMRQILRALAYLHSANVLHRDLKPSNILVTSTCEAKICDLGLARYVDYSKAKESDDGFVELTEYVVTRWYRAPEILLDGCRYDKPSDLWSAGCILGELLGRKPLFPGSSTTNQLNKIFNVLGTPDIAYISKIHKEAAQKWVHRQRRRSKIPFEELYPNANQQALDLLEKLLVYDPTQRITAVQALQHPYLREAFRSVMGDNSGDDEMFLYDQTEQKEDQFVGKIDDSNEYVAETKEAMQKAVFEQVCHFHPEAREYEEWLVKHDEKFCVDPQTGKLVPIKSG